jgi:hypothetical protein
LQNGKGEECKDFPIDFDADYKFVGLVCDEQERFMQIHFDMIKNEFDSLHQLKTNQN